MLRGGNEAGGMNMLAMLREEAKERQSDGQRRGGETAGKGRPKAENSIPVTLPGSYHEGESRERAAKAVQVGASTISRAKQVKDAVDAGRARRRRSGSGRAAEATLARLTRMSQTLAGTQRQLLESPDGA